MKKETICMERKLFGASLPMIKLKEFSKFQKEPFSQFLYKKEVDVGFTQSNLDPN